jgi:hypothetical protein
VNRRTTRPLAPLGAILFAACVEDGGLFSDVAPDTRISCPNGWTQGAAASGDSPHCFRIYEDATDFEHAVEACADAAEGAHLGTLDSQAEIEVVLPLLVGLQDGPWIGAEDLDMDCDFGWITEEPWSWPPSRPGEVPWAEGQPEMCGAENCAHLYAAGVFNDIGCELPLPRLCELELVD